MKNKIEKFKSIPENEQGETLLAMSSTSQVLILKNLSVEKIVSFLEFLDPHKSMRILRHLGKLKRDKVLARLAEDIQEKVKFLLKFAPRSAAGLMSLNYIETTENDTVEKVLKMIHVHERETGKTPTVLVVKKGYLVGEIAIHNFVLAEKSEGVSRFIHRIPHIGYTENEENIIKKFKKHPHGKLVVLDDKKRIMGVIYTDDILRLIENQMAKSLNRFAGINKEENVEDSAFAKVRFRYKWLILNLGTAFLAAAVVGLFENTISKWVFLAAYLPIVAGMGGNAATQTLAVTVRGMALGEIDRDNAKKIIKNELVAGIINGTITGIIAAAAAITINKTPLLGLVLGIAMVFNLFIAGLFGTIIPLIMKKLNKDPASSATIFITTATDVFGFLAFLGAATLILR